MVIACRLLPGLRLTAAVLRSESTKHEPGRPEKKWWQILCKCFAPAVPPEVSACDISSAIAWARCSRCFWCAPQPSAHKDFFERVIRLLAFAVGRGQDGGKELGETRRAGAAGPSAEPSSDYHAHKGGGAGTTQCDTKPV